MFKHALISMALTVSSFSLAAPTFANNEPSVIVVDPARQKLAEETVAKLIPVGSYQKMMRDMADQMANGLMEQMLGMDAAKMAGVSGDTSGKTLGELAAESDPNIKERMDITMKVTFEEMAKLMNAMEPTVRNALANIYAKKYSAQELVDMNTFFASKSGSAFASNFMASFTDKEMIQATMGMVPQMMEEMPNIVKKIEAATAHLPPIPKTDNNEATEEASSASVEDGNQPWYDSKNWTPAQQSKIAKLRASYGNAATKSEDAYFALESAEAEAVEEAEKRFIAKGWKPAPATETRPAKDDNAPSPPATNP